MITCRSQRRLVQSSVVLVALVGVAACGPDKAAPSSVALVVIDALRRDHLSLYGYAQDTSDVVDIHFQLAKRIWEMTS